MTDVFTQEIVALVVAALGYGAVQLRAWFLAKSGPGRLGTVHNLAQLAVTAAEEAAHAAAQSGAVMSSDGKYAVASTALTDLAKRVGLNLTDAEVHALIHAVLADVHGLFQPRPVAPPV